jgi:hypothetical protein
VLETGFITLARKARGILPPSVRFRQASGLSDYARCQLRFTRYLMTRELNVYNDDQKNNDNIDNMGGKGEPNILIEFPCLV